MTQIGTFSKLCHVLQDHSQSITRRVGDPMLIRREAYGLLQQHAHLIEPTVEHLGTLPMLLRSCSSLYRQTGLPPAVSARIASLCELGTEQSLDYNVLTSIAHSCLLLQQAGGGNPPSEPLLSSSSTAATQLLFTPVIRAAYDKAIHRMRSRSATLHTDTTIQLLRCSHDIYHHDHFSRFRDSKYNVPFEFQPVGTEMHSLLPIKGRVQMEAKLLRTGEAREILKHLRTLRCTRVDAGTLVNILAECGLYDEDVVNVCGTALHQSSSLLSSEQVAHALFGFGVLNHRHPQLRTLASRFDASSHVTAEGMRRMSLALASLQFPLPMQKKQLVDWVFMHALRFAENDLHAPPPTWFVDNLFALSCLGIKSHKFAMMTARRARRGIGKMSITHKLRFLHALGAVRNEQVSPNLQESWGKIGKTMDVIADVLKTNVRIQEAPVVASALIHCGYRDHPLVPRINLQHTQLNPVQQLLSAWSTKSSTPTAPTRGITTDPSHVVSYPSISRDAAMVLAEQIRPHHFGDGKVHEELTTVFKTLAFDIRCRAEHDVDRERFRTLCETVETQLEELPLEDVALVFRAMQQIGLLGQRYTRCRDMILERLWHDRFQFTADVQSSVFDTLEGVEQVDTVVELMEFIAAQRDGDTSITSAANGDEEQVHRIDFTRNSQEEF